MEQFEKVVLNCILYYNSKRIIENYPYTDDMLVEGVQPYAATIWNYGRKQPSADLIPVSREKLIRVYHMVSSVRENSSSSRCCRVLRAGSPVPD